MLIVLYYAGQPIDSLLEGQTRQVDSLWRLQQFDFWMREPGHLALALLRSYSSAPERFADTKDQLLAAFDRMLKDEQADIRRVKQPGASYNMLEDLDYSLSFLTARALVSDRPSFARSRQYSHQVVLETAGVQLVNKILDECPTFGWYRAQAELIAQYLPRLEHFDIAYMSYLAPELTPAMAATVPLVPFIRQRLEMTFGDTSHVDV
jgi:hypothetical protein